MEIKVLGAHNLETRTTRLACLVVDNVLALDAGSITSGLSLKEQEMVQAILLTHRHYDHVRDLPVLCLATFHNGNTLAAYGLEDTLETVRSHLLDGSMYPDFTSRPSPERPKLRLVLVQPSDTLDVVGYSVSPLPVRHGAPAVGYHVTSPDGKGFFYTGDTGGGLMDCWHQSPLDLVIIEVTYPDSLAEKAQEDGHLTPSMLEEELITLREVRGVIPPVAVVHMNPTFEREIRAELGEVSAALEASITPTREGLVLRI